MSSLTVTERHLWLTLANMRESERATFLNAPLSPTGLFGPAVNGIVDRFSEVQKTTQAMNLFLPRRSSSAAAALEISLLREALTSVQLDLRLRSDDRAAALNHALPAATGRLPHGDLDLRSR